ncbi:MAG: hypothetical protein R2762_10500 [Bryobacteraceae bacterium]
MSPALQIFLRPTGPWRMGAANGKREETDRIFHSDMLYGAVCSAMASLGWLEEWLDATARQDGEPAVRIGSLFPSVQGEALAPAPANLWPVAGMSRVRSGGARMIPMQLMGALAAGLGWNEESWEVDGPSECLVKRSGRGGRSLFRETVRSHGAVDRLGGEIAVHRTGCIEFGEDCGLWGLVEFAGTAAELWTDRVEACIRLLADTGLGGERTKGWGAFQIERMRRGGKEELLFGNMRRQGGDGNAADSGETGYWLLSLYNPSAGDEVDWTRGSYTVLDRGGRVESPGGWGVEKRRLRMIAEGSVLATGKRPRGAAHDVAPAGFAHPVYRCGFAVGTEIPLRVNA